MITYKCPSCGKLYNPEKNEICPKCGDATAPSVMTQIERRRIAQWLRTEGSHSYDQHCHDDDAWANSYGAAVHRAAVRSHEASLRAGYAAHRAVDNPTRLSNAGPAAQSRPAGQTRTATQTRPTAKKSSGKGSGKSVPWIIVIWMLYVLYRLFAALFD